MNPGGEPERDDTGLPPVDIEIPDDARDLDRDVQAYYRELRAQRRAQRRRRLLGTLAGDGIVLPLLACCLILALVTGTLLTVFTATSDQNPADLPGYARSPGSGHGHTGSAPGQSARPGAAAQRGSHRTPGTSGAPPSGSPAASGGPSPASAPRASPSGSPLVTTAAQLPGGSLMLAGGGRLPLRALSSSMLVLIPPACRCAATVQALAAVGLDTRAPTYLVGTPSTATEVQQLAADLKQPERAAVAVATDQNSVLGTAIPVAGLTVLVVGADGSLSWTHQLAAPLPVAPVLSALARCPSC